MYGALDITTSGLIAQRMRMTVASSNIANTRSIMNSDGEYEPFRRRTVVLAAGDPDHGTPLGVHVSDIEIDQGELMPEYDPSSPHADADGYVYYPNINPVVEQMNAMQALRSYEANIAVAEATKSMMTTALRMLS